MEDQRKGSAKEVRDGNGRTPWMLAAIKGDTEVGQEFFRL